jgi:hypothetical protein
MKRLNSEIVEEKREEKAIMIRNDSTIRWT